MTKVITYGTYDLLHYGHVRLLERAKALGDYLIVGVTAEDFDRSRGKINVSQSLMERIEAVRATGIADEIIVEEYEGQKIDDIRRYDVDIFTVGSDWVGKFDYLNEYCKVVYLDRTEGISSTQQRNEKCAIKLGLVGESNVVNKFAREAEYVNGIELSGVCAQDDKFLSEQVKNLDRVTQDYKELLEKTDAVYIISHPSKHYEQIKLALENGKHVLCESPVALEKQQCRELYALAKEKKLILCDALKTAYSMAYFRLLLQAKTGCIGKIICVEATCTSLSEKIEENEQEFDFSWNSFCSWAPTAMLPVFHLLGTNYKKRNIVTKLLNEEKHYDLFTKIDFVYDDAVASIKVGKGVKSEGELIISGTKGYIYVPAPWWKTDYYEIRYENAENNTRHFYQLDGEGIRYELVTFVKAIESGNIKSNMYMDEEISLAISKLVEEFENDIDITKI